MALVAMGRFEWERIVRRAALPRPAKLLALTLSTYADPDGSRVRPGNAALVAVTGYSPRSVGRILGELSGRFGLLELVARGGGRGGTGKTATYRLTVPTDLLDRIELLSPAEQSDDSSAIQVTPETPESSATQVTDQSGDSSDTQMADESLSTPVDNSVTDAIQMADENEIHRPNNGVTERLIGQNGSIDRPSGWPTTTHIPTTTDQDLGSVRTQPLTARANDQPRLSLDEILPLTRAADGSAAAGPKCDHGLSAGTDDAGRPRCPACRRGLPASGGSP